MGFIYTLTSPSGKSYVGQTIRPIEERFNEHQKPSSYCVLLYRAIDKHGWDNFTVDYYECPDDELNKHETWMIRLMGTLSPGGYNLKEGGSRGKMSEESKKKMSESRSGEKHHFYGKTHTEESKKKMSEVHIGKKLSEEAKKKLSDYNTGKILTEEHKKKLSEAHTGKKHTGESKKKMSEAKLGDKNYLYGKERTDETKKKIGEAQLGEKNHASKKVYQYDLDGNYIQPFGSCREAGRHLKKDRSSISQCASGKQKTAHKFRWSYEFHDQL
ncbi:GIY-YIG catalytic domain-containing endonuclease [Only Syngen Nebraska virus 5]|uniref:GIY-YIG catalytic domain-containing endonuclease n=1 Tax=Only Syngen Nebraska virus 5 TaxID=1917232 RepID=UPI000901BDE8|nr:GIY-YIG catalytic domain-containing endonuclease [Only Syngen Nebraska virus 5]APC25574.1 GIY-YIG catalytic domain-containing endonuclease [Only Syngen Nebraska virus 5]